MHWLKIVALESCAACHLSLILAKFLDLRDQGKPRGKENACTQALGWGIPSSVLLGQEPPFLCQWCTPGASRNSCAQGGGLGLAVGALPCTLLPRLGCFRRARRLHSHPCALLLACLPARTPCRQAPCWGWGAACALDATAGPLVGRGPGRPEGFSRGRDGAREEEPPRHAPRSSAAATLPGGHRAKRHPSLPQPGKATPAPHLWGRAERVPQRLLP